MKKIGAALLALLVTAGCVQTVQLNQQAADVNGRPVAVLRNPPIAFGRMLANAGSGNLLYDVLNTTLQGVTEAHKELFGIAAPTTDPARITEGLIAGHLTGSLGAVAHADLAGAIPAGGEGEERVAKIVSLARDKKFTGLVIDLPPEKFRVIYHDHPWAIGGGKVQMSFAAQFRLIDVSTGKVLAAGECAESDVRVTPAKTALEQGQAFTNGKAEELGRKCAEAIIRRALG
ncbi:MULTISPECIES: hypothetical protein [unclassified Chelatococcus]|uniref:hypothetical protein n=1 Tax=unclassified Chelatococcus TaxID=2638111 RepID=UPI00030356A5|nr:MULTISPECIES: hypothetical protein [unclassified Chelatococcus]ALA16261.1 hypothetical protein AL346_01125 [Chelatococcus sp. CO-6]